jgi:hypothetical protein
MATSTHWRFYCSANNGDASWSELSDVYYSLDSGSSWVQFTGGSSFASSSYFSDNGARAFDNNSGTYWLGSTPNAYAGYALASSITPTHFKIISQGHSAEFTRTFKDFKIQYSNDSGSTWLDWGSYTNMTDWRYLMPLVFDQTSLVVGDVWEVNITANNGDSYVEIEEISYSTDGSTYLPFTGGYSYASADYYNEKGYRAFDNKPPGWYWQASPAVQYVGYVFPYLTSPAITHIKIISVGYAGETAKAIKDFKIRKSVDNRATFVDMGSYTNQTGWTYLEERVFTIGTFAATSMLSILMLLCA